MTISTQCWKRSGRISLIFADNLVKCRNDPYKAAIATGMNVCGNCPTRWECIPAIVAASNGSPESIAMEAGKAMARCGVLFSWKINVTEAEAPVEEEQKMKVLGWFKEKPEAVSG